MGVWKEDELCCCCQFHWDSSKAAQAHSGPTRLDSNNYRLGICTERVSFCNPPAGTLVHRCELFLKANQGELWWQQSSKHHGRPLKLESQLDVRAINFSPI